MPSDVTREEFETRVGVLEREVEGEKLVTRHIFEQTRHNGADLAAIKTRLDRVEHKVDVVDQKIGGLDQKIDGVAGQLDSKIDGVESRLSDRIGSLERSMPKIVGDVMREVLRERGGKA